MRDPFLNVSGMKNQKGKYNRDLKGVVFNKLTVVAWNPLISRWECECECGGVLELTSNQITEKKIQPYSCGCVTRWDLNQKPLGGVRFGKLVVVKPVKSAEDLVGEKEFAKWSGTSSRLWICECDCGGRTVRSTPDLERETVKEKSCGCVKVDRRKDAGNKNYKNKSFNELNQTDVLKRYLGKVYNGLTVTNVREDRHGNPELRLGCSKCGFYTLQSVPVAVRGRFVRCSCNK
jgi:hypothetical protein